MFKLAVSITLQLETFAYCLGDHRGMTRVPVEGVPLSDVGGPG